MGKAKTSCFKLRIFLFFLVCLFSYSPIVKAQTGNYYITNYTPANYHAGDQNKGIVQDKFGRIYVANNNGVLIYDGEYWKIAPIKNSLAATSIDADKNGNVFVGSQYEIGYLEKDEKGTIKYNSLNSKLKKEEIVHEAVWSTNCLNNSVHFLSFTQAMVYDYNTIKTFKPKKGNFHRQFVVGKNLFVRETNNGFWVYKNKELVFVKGSEVFGEISVRFIVPQNKNNYYVGTESGLYQMNYNENKPEESTFIKIQSDLDEWLITKKIYSGYQLRDGSYILGSQTGGMLQLDKEFKIQHSLEYKSGLQDDYVYAIYQDFTGNIWLSLNKGLSYIEISSPITKWTKLNNIKGTIQATTIFNNELFIATDKGVQVYDEKSKTFINKDINIETWDFAKTQQTLFIASEGVYAYSGGKINLALEYSTTYKLHIDKANPSIIYVGGIGYFTVGKIEGNTIKSIKDFEINGTARGIFEHGNFIYFSIEDVGIIQLNKTTLDTTRYNTKDGLPDLAENHFFYYDNKILLGTPAGIYSFDDKRKPAFKRDDNLNAFPKTDQIVKPFIVGNEIFAQRTFQFENITKIDELTTLSIKNNKMVEDKKYLKRIREVETKSFYQKNNIVYISTNDGLFCYDINYKQDTSTYITLISSAYSDKDTLYHNLSESTNLETNINFSNNTISFDLAATNYIDKHEMEFAFYLEGNTDNYGKWTKNNTATFSNLHEGKYILHAKSRDVLGHEGKEITFSLIILPPWYRTTWAYIAYFILFVIVVWIIVALNTKRLRAQNIKLENTITERTKTIAHQMVEIEHKNKEITDSINYAKGIQDSILPDIKEIKKTWADTFVYFQPKDIVSGDFFWYKKINDNEFLIACADCTGHGVPGGFMSMICSDKLHDSAKESVQPKDILFGTNNGVKTTLKQEIIVEGKSKDGMEVCLLKINTQTQEISYSGANRLLWIVDGETKELTEIKPTKASIASFTEFNFEYQQHDFKLKKGDIVYATSDGFPDQFGGAEGKKYMSKKMKAFILSICDLPMDEQHDLLKKEINDWMLGHEQVDDLLVIGVRL